MPQVYIADSSIKFGKPLATICCFSTDKSQDRDRSKSALLREWERRALSAYLAPGA